MPEDAAPKMIRHILIYWVITIHLSSSDYNFLFDIEQQKHDYSIAAIAKNIYFLTSQLKKYKQQSQKLSV